MQGASIDDKADEVTSIPTAALRRARTGWRYALPLDTALVTSRVRARVDAVSKKYVIDLGALAAEFAGKSPDWEMRASLKLVTSEKLGG